MRSCEQVTSVNRAEGEKPQFFCNSALLKGGAGFTRPGSKPRDGGGGLFPGEDLAGLSGVARPQLLPRPWPARWLRHARTREAGRKGDARQKATLPLGGQPGPSTSMPLASGPGADRGSVELRVVSHMLRSHGQSHGWGDGEGRGGEGVHFQG